MALSARRLVFWRIYQFTALIFGGGLLYLLVFFSDTGIQVFWNALIPAAPLLLIFTPGLWRNVCPLGVVSMLPHWVKRSKKLPVSPALQGKFQFFAVMGLFLVIPLRHLFLNTNGPATAVFLLSAALMALAAGMFFGWKSGWCLGLCPIYPVERLYGNRGVGSFPNAHCGTCGNCVAPCYESVRNMHPLYKQHTRWHRVSSVLLVGGFPGFIWGWFHVPDMQGEFLPGQIALAYGLPALGMTVSLLVFMVLHKRLVAPRRQQLIRAYTFAAVGFYYWYRLPALLGYGVFPGDGMLVDLRQDVTPAAVFALQSGIMLLLLWWFFGTDGKAPAWNHRPPYEERTK